MKLFEGDVFLMLDEQAGQSDGHHLEVATIRDLMRVLPHRYPMLMVDKMVGICKGKGAVGIKNVTVNEPFFQGHFPIQPVMPGVLVVEAMAQTGAAFIAYTEHLDVEGKVILFMSVDKARFRRPVVPGDQLHLHVSLQRKRAPVWRFYGEGRVDGRLVADATFAAMLSEPVSQ